MLRTRRLICLLALILALPSAAFAQGAGDDQYQDPFAEEPAQTQQGDTPEGDLGDEPPGGGEDQGGSGSSGSGDSGSGSGSGSGGGSGAGGGSGGPGGTTTTPRATGNDGLPLTGADPRPLLLVGLAFLLGGIGLRLRTIDPNDF